MGRKFFLHEQTMVNINQKSYNNSMAEKKDGRKLGP